MSRVDMRITALALLRMLRLPDDTQLRGAQVRWLAGGEADVLVLTLDMPGAPEDAAEATAFYTRASGWPDPVSLAGITWTRADGSEIKLAPDTGLLHG